jgi:3D (Asp-Asp-Asp) domain-containing protein
VTLTARGNIVVGSAVGIFLVASPGLAGMVGKALTGVSDTDLMTPTENGASNNAPTETAGAVPLVQPLPSPSRASRSRNLTPSADGSRGRGGATGRTLDVTAYCHTGNRTASGLWPKPGMAANNTYRFGTRLRVEGLGVVVVQDRIGWGSQLDLFMSSCREAREFGRRQLRVEVVR